MSNPFSFTADPAENRVIRSDGKVVADYDPETLEISLTHSAYSRHADEIETAVAVIAGELDDDPGIPPPETPEEMAEAVLEPPLDPTMGKSGSEFIIWAAHHMDDEEFEATYGYKKAKLIRRLATDKLLASIPRVVERIKALPEPEPVRQPEALVLTPEEIELILARRAKASKS